MNQKSRLPVLLVILVIVVAVAFLLKAKGERGEGVYSYPSLASEETKTSVWPSYSATPKASAPSSAKAPASAAPVPTRIYENGIYVNIVRFTGTGFNPQVVNINRGESVRFINTSGAAMRIVSNIVKGVPVYHGFDQTSTLGKGGVFELPFTETGIFAYHNTIGDQSSGGLVHVK